MKTVISLNKQSQTRSKLFVRCLTNAKIVIAGCLLNFTSLPYQPNGDCIDHENQLKLKSWGILTTTLCCQTPLTLISKSLARLSTTNSSNSSIFLDCNQWSTCRNTPIFQPQQKSVNFEKCNFKNFFKEATFCSKLSILELKKYSEYNDSTAACGQLDQSNNSFDEICRTCSHAILKARDSVVKGLQVNGNETENEICGIAVVTALASEKWNESSFAAVDDLYACLRILDVHGKIFLYQQNISPYEFEIVT